MQWKSGTHFWEATTQQSLIDQVISFNWILSLKPEQLTDATRCPSPLLSCLCGQAGSVIASNKLNQAFLVLTPGNHGLLAWPLEAVNLDGKQAHKPIQDRNAVAVLHITDVDSWLDVPVVPGMQGSHGGVVFIQNGDKENLCKARVKQGLNLTVVQMKNCLSFFNVTMPGQPSKAAVFSRLVEIVLGDNAEEQQLAITMASAALENEDAESQLSDYEDLLHLLEEDTENALDPDIKHEKARIKKQKVLKQLKEAPPGDALVQSKRGRPKGKGKGRGRPKGTTSCGNRGRGGKGRGRRRIKNQEPQNVDDESEPVLALQDQEATEITEPVVSIVAMPNSNSVPESVPADHHATPENLASVVVTGTLHPDESEPVDDVLASGPPEIPEHLPSPSVANQVPAAASEPTPILEPTSSLSVANAVPAGVSEPTPPEPTSSPSFANAVPAASEPLDVAASVAPEEPAPLPAVSAEAVPEMPPASLAPTEASGEPSIRVRGPNVFSSPEALLSISPPGCTIRLNGALAFVFFAIYAVVI